MRAAIASSDEPAHALRKVVHDFAVHHAHARTSARIVNYELTALTPEHFAEIRNLRRSIEQEIRDLVTQGVEAGVFDTPDPHMASIALLSLGIDIARWYRDDSRWTPENIATRYAEMALRVVGTR